MKPDRIEFVIGQTRFGQTIRLVWERGSDNVFSWTIHQDAASQRDDSAVIRNIPTEVMTKMAEAASGAPQR